MIFRVFVLAIVLMVSGNNASQLPEMPKTVTYETRTLMTVARYKLLGRWWVAWLEMDANSSKVVSWEEYETWRSMHHGERKRAGKFLELFTV